MKTKLLVAVICLLIIVLTVVLPHLPKGTKDSVSENEISTAEETTEQFETEERIQVVGDVKLDIYDLEKQIYYCPTAQFTSEALDSFCSSCYGAFGKSGKVSEDKLVEMYNRIIELCDGEDVVYLLGKPSETGIYIHVCNYRDFTSFRESFELGD